MFHDNDFVYFKEKCFCEQEDTDATENNKRSEKKLFEKKKFTANRKNTINPIFSFQNLFRCIYPIILIKKK